MNRARLTASRNISFGALERRGGYLMELEGHMWRDSRPALTTYSREAVVALQQRYEAMLSARDMDTLTVLERAAHVQMCTDLALGDLGEMLALRCAEEGSALYAIRKEYAGLYGALLEYVGEIEAKNNALETQLEGKDAEAARVKQSAAALLSETAQKYEDTLAALKKENSALIQQQKETQKQHEAEKKAMDKRFAEFNALLQSIRNDERMAKYTSSVAE